MNRIAAANGTFNAFGSISCMLIVKRIWTCHMEFAMADDMRHSHVRAPQSNMPSGHACRGAHAPGCLPRGMSCRDRWTS